MLPIVLGAIAAGLGTALTTGATAMLADQYIGAPLRQRRYEEARDRFISLLQSLQGQGAGAGQQLPQIVPPSVTYPAVAPPSTAEQPGGQEARKPGEFLGLDRTARIGRGIALEKPKREYLEPPKVTTPTVLPQQLSGMPSALSQPFVSQPVLFPSQVTYSPETGAISASFSEASTKQNFPKTFEEILSRGPFLDLVEQYLAGTISPQEFFTSARQYVELVKTGAQNPPQGYKIGLGPPGSGYENKYIYYETRGNVSQPVVTEGSDGKAYYVQAPDPTRQSQVNVRLMPSGAVENVAGDIYTRHVLDKVVGGIEEVASRAARGAYPVDPFGYLRGDITGWAAQRGIGMKKYPELIELQQHLDLLRRLVVTSGGGKQITPFEARLLTSVLPSFGMSAETARIKARSLQSVYDFIISSRLSSYGMAGYHIPTDIGYYRDVLGIRDPDALNFVNQTLKQLQSGRLNAQTLFSPPKGPGGTELFEPSTVRQEMQHLGLPVPQGPSGRPSLAPPSAALPGVDIGAVLRGAAEEAGLLEGQEE
jgi:hypothetical protein